MGWLYNHQVLLFTNAFKDFWQESKALNALQALKEKLAKKAMVFRDVTCPQSEVAETAINRNLSSRPKFNISEPYLRLPEDSQSQ